MLRLKLNRVSKWGPWSQTVTTWAVHTAFLAHVSTLKNVLFENFPSRETMTWSIIAKATVKINFATYF